jgi:hypothetical protein
MPTAFSNSTRLGLSLMAIVLVMIAGLRTLAGTVDRADSALTGSLVYLLVQPTLCLASNVRHVV